MGGKQKRGGKASPDLAQPVLKNTLPPIGHVLIVEDDSLLSLAMEQALSDGGASKVTVCAGTQQALEVLREAKPQVVVLDVHLADSDEGYEIAELLSAIGPNPPKIIFSTGAPQDIPEDIASLGAILEKPYNPERLVELAREPRRKGLLALLTRRKAKT